MDPLGTRCPLIIYDEESSRKRCRVVASLTNDDEDEDEVSLARRQRAQGASRMPTSPRAPTPPRAMMPPRAPTPSQVAMPPRAPTPPQVATPSLMYIPSTGHAGSAVPEGVLARRERPSGSQMPGIRTAGSKSRSDQPFRATFRCSDL
jgi:hypothetical protein